MVNNTGCKFAGKPDESMQPQGVHAACSKQSGRLDTPKFRRSWNQPFQRRTHQVSRRKVGAVPNSYTSFRTRVDSDNDGLDARPANEPPVRVERSDHDWLFVEACDWLRDFREDS